MIERYDALRLDAEQAFGRGDLELAARLFGDAERLASELGEHDLADRAFCNRCAVLIQLDRGTEEVPRLKQLLLRSTDPKVQFLAAYYTGMALHLDQQDDKAVQYVERARDLARGHEDPAQLAGCSNLLGTIALRASRFEEAEACFDECLRAWCPDVPEHRQMAAQVRDNQGYLFMCSERLDEGVRLCEESRADLESDDAGPYLCQVLQDLCYGYLLQERLEEAQECGERALQLAAAASDELVAKNCLFLLSEVAVRKGDTFGARRRLRELQSYYPETAVSDEIIEVFLTTDLTTVVNLRG